MFQGGPLEWLVRQGGIGRAVGSTHGANILGIVAGMSFAYFSIRAAGRESLRELVLALLMAAACLPALYFTFSRSAALGVGIGVVLGLYLLGRRASMLVAVVLVVGAIIVGPILIASRLDTSSGRVDGNRDPLVAEAQANSDRLRVQAWAAGLRMAIAKPISGVGFGRYPELRQRYGGPKELNTPHSDYIRFFAETGVPGGAAFLLFLCGIAWSLKGASGPHRAGLAAALAAFCIATQFNAQLYYLESAIPFWVAAGSAIGLRSVPIPERPTGGYTAGDRDLLVRRHARPNTRPASRTRC
jgi:O-antigen ligase